MKLNVNTISTALILMIGLHAKAASPMNLELKADGITRIECDVDGKPETVVAFQRVENGRENPEKSTKTTNLHYDLYIPKGYHSDTSMHYPAMFISSPGGNAKMGAMAERLKKDRWLVIMLIEAKNGAPDWVNNFTAAHDDVVKRVRVAKGAKFATGMSGGARCSSVYACLRPGFRGIICQAAGFAYGFEKLNGIEFYAKYPDHIAVASTWGIKDFNHYESQEFRRSLKKGTAQYVEFFQGGHNWCPEDTFSNVMDWIEETVFVDSPVRATSCRLFTRNATAESMDGGAYTWYVEVLRRRLDEEEDNVEKYHLLSKLVAAIKNGKLPYDKDLKTLFSDSSQELYRLKNEPDVRQEVGALKYYRKAMDYYNAFETSMTKGRAIYKKRYFTKNEKSKVSYFIKTYEKMLEKYPNSPCTRRLGALKKSLDLEIQ